MPGAAVGPHRAGKSVIDPPRVYGRAVASSTCGVPATCGQHGRLDLTGAAPHNAGRPAPARATTMSVDQHSSQVLATLLERLRDEVGATLGRTLAEYFDRSE